MPKTLKTMWRIVRYLMYVVTAATTMVILLACAGLVHDKVFEPETTTTMIADANAHAASIGKNPPKEFTYDGCTLIPETLDDIGFNFNLHPSCLAHDIAYWAGGSKEQRAAADQALYDGVRTQVGWFPASIVYFVVDQLGDTALARIFTGRNWGHGFNQ